MTAPALDRARLLDWIEQLGHLLPAQAPIRDFVHHNTLHGFQHLPFTEAVAAAHALTGAWPYWPEARFRAAHAAGRILDEDLDAGLDELFGETLSAPAWPGVSRRQLLRAALTAPGPAEQPPPDAHDPLWQTCQSACIAFAPPPTDWPTLAERRRAAAFAPGAPTQTYAQQLAHLTGESLMARWRQLLQPVLAAHLDAGIAAWHHPQAEGGLFAAWRAAAMHDLSWDLENLPGAQHDIEGLPDDPVAVIADALDWLCPGASAHGLTYLCRLTQALPGWFGMCRRLSGADGQPMLDALAIALTIERLLCVAASRQLTGHPCPPSELAVWAAAHPAEFLVRDTLSRLDLPEDLQSAGQRLCLEGASDPAAWAAVAEKLADSAVDRKPMAHLLHAAVARLPAAAQATLPAEPAAIAPVLDDLATLTPLRRGHLWLLAYERRYRELLFGALAALPQAASPSPPPRAQVICCMDDREEGTRRHLEEIAPDVDTYGAAGFFGIPMRWQGLDDPHPAAHCPVVTTPAHAVREQPLPHAEAAARRRARSRSRRLQRQTRLAQATRLEAVRGPLLTLLAAPFTLAGLLASQLAPAWLAGLRARWAAYHDPVVATRLDVTGESPASATGLPGLSDTEQIERVANFLHTLGLTRHFAPLVLLLGHGSDSRNNPHRSAYACGACGGRHGGPNARVFATLANRPVVREGLAARGIVVPPDTWFVAAEHNTCDDSISWFDLEAVPADHQPALDRLLGELAEACRAHAVERCRRLASAPAAPTPWQAFRHVRQRRFDYAQPRPELGHATNAAALIGRRQRSRGLFLDRRVFLISYDPLQDADGRIVEQLLLAAGPVGAGINLEYYFSTVDNERFGCGSKVTHNLAGNLGVMAGTASDLRTGLPWQMVEIHEPMRLLVVVEQTPAVLTAILARQPALRELFDHGWLLLACQCPEDGTLHQYDPARGWAAWRGMATPPPVVARSQEWFAGESGALAPARLLGEVRP